MTVRRFLAEETAESVARALEYDALEPPVSRRDLEALFGLLTAMVCNASGNFKRFMKPEDFFPSLKPEGQEPAGQSPEERNRTRFALLALQADIALMNGRG